MCFTSGLVAALVLLQNFAWADQCTSTKCTGQSFESNDMEWDKCWGSSSDDINYPFACEEGYEVHDFSIGWYDFSYYTCCIAVNTTAANAVKCVETVCTDIAMDCFVPECGFESMTCGSDNFPYPNPTGASYYNQKVHELLYHYVCCDMEISDIPPLICDSSELKIRSKITLIVGGASAIISIISSITIVWVICRSKDGLSKGTHRILTAMSITDIIFSFSFVDFGAASPKEYESIWNAHGTEESCFAFGVMYAFGIICGPYYSASLNVHYLVAFKYTKKTSRRVEPFLHLVPVLTGVSATIVYILFKNVDNYKCTAGLPTILSAVLLVGVPITIVFMALGMMYWTIRTQAKRMSKYGVGSLRESAQFTEEANSERNDKSTLSQAFGWSSISSLLSGIRGGKRKARPAPNMLTSYNQAILTKAKLYALAFLLTYIFVFCSTFLFESPVLDYLTNVFLPLQGFWNLLIFMHPKVTAAKNQSMNNEITWRQAIVKAFSPHRKQQTNAVQNQVNHLCPDNLGCNNPKTKSTKKNRSVRRKEKSHEGKFSEVCETEISSSAISTLYGKNNRATISERGSNAFESSLELPYRKQQGNLVQNQVNHPSPANLGCIDPKTESTKKNRSVRIIKESPEEEKVEICDEEIAPSAMSILYAKNDQATTSDLE